MTQQGQQQQGPIIFNGRYELHRRLGRGGMAEVYLARDQMLDRPVAVKVLFPALATDPGFVERFRREAQSAAALNHPNIVGVYDWGEANGTYFIVMEYVEGESLAELIHAEGRVHPDRAAEIGADIASALGFAHRNGGVIHRDVKPGNVMITRDGDVKVADFGIARAISDSSDTNLTKTGSVMGTATYFSPEQARGAAIDPRSDLYSLGCVLYEMVIGRPPFAGENAVAIAYKHVQEPAPPPRELDPAVPDTLEAIIMKCLAKNADNRYPSAQDLRADLRRYLDGARIMAEPVMAGMGDPGATGMMAPTGYMQPTAATSPYGDPYGDTYDDGYGDEEEEKKSKAPLVLLILLLMLLAGLLLWWALSGRGDGSSEVEVPADLVGMQVDAAENELDDLGLEANRDAISDEADLEEFDVSVDDIAEGEVIAQSPEGGEVLEEGDSVTLTYWAGEDVPIVAIPDLKGKPSAEATSELANLGFTNVKVETEETDEVEENQVIRTDPENGTEIKVTDELTVYVSEGAEQVEVPSVEGQNATDAESAIAGVGLTVGEKTEEFSDSVPDGSVISQNPAGGTMVDPGTAVTLVISKGEEVTDNQVPDVKGQFEDAARTILEGNGFQVSVSTVQVPNADQDGLVQSQNPQAGTSHPEGTSVTITIGEWSGPDTTVPTTPTTLFPPPGDD